MKKNKTAKDNTILRLLQELKPWRAGILTALILGCIGAFLNVIGPEYLSKITDLITAGLQGHIDLAAVSKICLWLAALYIIGWILGYIQSWMMAGVAQKSAESLRTRIIDKINNLPLSFFDSSSIGDILSIVTNDVDLIAQTLNNSLPTLVSSLTLFFGAMIMMLLSNWQMALAGILSVFAGFVLMIVIITKSQKHFELQQEQLGKLNGQIEETYSGLEAVMAYNGQQQAKQKFQTTNNQLYISNWKSQFYSGLMMPLMLFIGNLGYVVVCVLGAVLAAKGIITFGTIVSFMVYIRLFTQPLSQISQSMTNLQQTIGAGKRVFHFLDEEELSDESHKRAMLKQTDGNIDFSHVKFGYTKDRTIIKDFSASVQAGDKVAIVGPTGAGKTTLVNLLMRFYDLDSGKIQIEGIDTQDLTRENVHDLFCMVLQDTWIFEGTLRENLTYSKENISDEQLDAVCRAVGLDHFVQSLPDGYDTVLSEENSFSAGQKQLVTIARAMLKDAPLLILDEATSVVDTRTEQQVQKAMDALMEGRTSFVIAHRLSTIQNADRILVLQDGDIIEQGTHDELLARKGYYADLYQAQFAL